MKDILLIYNPKAGDTTFRFSLDRFIEIFSEKNMEIRIFRCSDTGSAREYLEEADLTNTTAIFAAGGTGTINEVVSAMLDHGIKLPLGIIPAGIQNEVARKLGFGNDLEKNLKALAKMETLKLDVAKCQDYYFVDEMSRGTVSSLVHTSAEMKNTFGSLANYMMSVTAIKKLKKMKLQIEFGDRRYTGTFQYFSIINGDLKKDPLTAGGKYVLIASKKTSYSGEKRILMEDSDKTGVIDKGTLRIVGNHFRVEALDTEEPIHVQIDGELGPALPVDIQILPQALECFYDAEGLEKKTPPKKKKD